jgi:uncharacterized protein YgbK (DUF1537 family)
MDRVVIIADDFTGANDTSMYFAGGGLRAVFVFDKESITRAFDSCDAIGLCA